MTMYLCCDQTLKESSKEEQKGERDTKKGNGASEGCVVLCMFGTFAALDKWTSLEKPVLFTQ